MATLLTLNLVSVNNLKYVMAEDINKEEVLANDEEDVVTVLEDSDIVANSDEEIREKVEDEPKTTQDNWVKLSLKTTKEQKSVYKVGERVDFVLAFSNIREPQNKPSSRWALITLNHTKENGGTNLDGTLRCGYTGLEATSQEAYCYTPFHIITEEDAQRGFFQPFMTVNLGPSSTTADPKEHYKTNLKVYGDKLNVSSEEASEEEKKETKVLATMIRVDKEVIKEGTKLEYTLRVVNNSNTPVKVEFTESNVIDSYQINNKKAKIDKIPAHRYRDWAPRVKPYLWQHMEHVVTLDDLKNGYTPVVNYKVSVIKPNGEVVQADVESGTVVGETIRGTEVQFDIGSTLIGENKTYYVGSDGHLSQDKIDELSSLKTRSRNIKFTAWQALDEIGATKGDLIKNEQLAEYVFTENMILIARTANLLASFVVEPATVEVNKETTEAGKVQLKWSDGSVLDQGETVQVKVPGKKEAISLTVGENGMLELPKYTVTDSEEDKDLYIILHYDTDADALLTTKVNVSDSKEAEITSATTTSSSTSDESTTKTTVENTTTKLNEEINETTTVEVITDLAEVTAVTSGELTVVNESEERSELSEELDKSSTTNSSKSSSELSKKQKQVNKSQSKEKLPKTGEILDIKMIVLLLFLITLSFTVKKNLNKKKVN